MKVAQSLETTFLINVTHPQGRSQGGGEEGATAPPQSQKKHSLKKAKSVQKLGGGGGTRYILEAETD